MSYKQYITSNLQQLNYCNLSLDQTKQTLLHLRTQILNNKSIERNQKNQNEIIDIQEKLFQHIDNIYSVVQPEFSEKNKNYDSLVNFFLTFLDETSQGDKKVKIQNQIEYMKCLEIKLSKDLSYAYQMKLFQVKSQNQIDILKQLMFYFTEFNKTKRYITLDRSRAKSDYFQDNCDRTSSLIKTDKKKPPSTDIKLKKNNSQRLITIKIKEPKEQKEHKNVRCFSFKKLEDFRQIQNESWFAVYQNVPGFGNQIMEQCKSFNHRGLRKILIGATFVLTNKIQQKYIIWDLRFSKGNQNEQEKVYNSIEKIFPLKHVSFQYKGHGKNNKKYEFTFYGQTWYRSNIECLAVQIEDYLQKQTKEQQFLQQFQVQNKEKSRTKEQNFRFLNPFFEYFISLL